MVGRPGEEGKSGDGDGRWVAWRALAVQGAVRPCLGRGRHGRSSLEFVMDACGRGQGEEKGK